MFFLNRYRRLKFISSRNNFQMQITISFLFSTLYRSRNLYQTPYSFFLSLVCKSEEFSTEKLLSKYDSLSIVKIRNLVNRKTLSNVTIYQTQTGFLFLFVIFANTSVSAIADISNLSSGLMFSLKVKISSLKMLKNLSKL